MTRDASPALLLRQLTKRFGDVLAVDRVDLEVKRGEFLTLLGPSGSGKTTTLRMIAGFTEPTGGSIELAGADVTRVPAYRRDIGMVFQSYALFPHMTAGQNIAFPLEMRGQSRADINRHIGAALARVRLDGYADRYPRQLSGGQQQRVAVARALVFEPHLLLMDEPLGALDRKLREDLQQELKRIHSELGITVVYVTHDQDEALALSDRVAIFNAGRIEQLGSAEDLYERPASLFVADFLGDANVFRGTVVGGLDGTWIDSQGLRIPILGRDVQASSGLAVVVRPERISLGVPESRAGPDGAAFRARGRIRDLTYLGSGVKYLVDVGPHVVAARIPIGARIRRWNIGDEVEIEWQVGEAVVVAANPTDPRQIPEGGSR